LIVLVRHGATDHNAEGRFLSRTDLPLNEQGRRQVEALAQTLDAYRFARCYSSPMRRCIETADIVAPKLERVVDSSLREIDFGDWEGETAESIGRSDPEGLAERKRDPVHFRPPNGESFEDVALRLQALREQLQDATGDMLVVAHRGSLGVLERLLRDLPLNSQTATPLEPAQFHEIISNG
jgi:broad specificity phosphatase PhoE